MTRKKKAATKKRASKKKKAPEVVENRGRKPRSASGASTRYLKIRSDDDELERLDADAELTGGDRSRYVRALMFDPRAAKLRQAVWQFLKKDAEAEKES